VGPTRVLKTNVPSDFSPRRVSVLHLVAAAARSWITTFPDETPKIDPRYVTKLCVRATRGPTRLAAVGCLASPRPAAPVAQTLAAATANDVRTAVRGRRTRT